jgi:cobalt-precorrin 5A hydrolase/precorrin-3B C17-methyltransferase
MNTENNTPVSGEISYVIFHVTGAARLTAERLAAYFKDARVVKYSHGAVNPYWSPRHAIIFVTASGIAVRAVAPLVGDKLTDPAVVVVDEAGRFAVSLLGGHAGGANRMARDIAAFLGAQAVITTASDVRGLPSPDLWAKENSLVVDGGTITASLGGAAAVSLSGAITAPKSRIPNDAGGRTPNDAGGRTPVGNSGAMTRASAKLLEAGYLNVYADTAIALPDVFRPVKSPREADVIVSNTYAGASHVGDHESTHGADDDRRLVLRPKNLVLGIGCNGGTAREEIENAVAATLNEHGLSFLSVALVATIDIKGEEPGLVGFAQVHGLRVITFTAGELNTVETSARSEVVFSATGAWAVAEPSALLAASAASPVSEGALPASGAELPAAGTGLPVSGAALSESAASCDSGANKSARLIVLKQKRGNVTVAVAESAAPISAAVMENRRGIIYVVGTGPGGAQHITPRALRAIRQSDVIVGYATYLRHIQDLIHDKKTVATAMTQEVDRCRRAVELAEEGLTVSVISGGDPGIYAMAGLVYEILLERQGSRAQTPVAGTTAHIPTGLVPALRPPVSCRRRLLAPPDIEVIPGISALNACAARLGAPLMHDFAVVSLSDRLTPWDTIIKRLEAAAAADFVIVLYNPKSKGRASHVQRARDIILAHRTPQTPVGIVRAAMRPDETAVITDLENMCSHDIDMQTTVIIGNSKTIVSGGAMITPRGYADKYDLKK